MIKHNRVTLINCDKQLIIKILKGDECLADKLDIKIPNQWSEFGNQIFQYTLNCIEEKPAQLKWFAYLPIDNESNTLLGSCGYKGEPDENGMVEIGYEVAKDYRNRGYATEITNLLINNAFQDKKVKIIQAHTLAEKNASVRVLEKCKFQFVEAYNDETDWPIWKWILNK